MNTWDLTYLYKTEEDFHKACEELKPLIAKVPTFKGTLNDEKHFVDYLLLEDEIEERLSKAFQYAHLASDLNKKDVKGLSNLQKVYFILNDLMQVAAFESPEILSLGKEKVMKFVNDNEKIKAHKFILEKLFHSNEHVLDGEKEQLLSYFNSLDGFSGQLYEALTTADNISKKIKLSDRREVTVTQGNWRSLIEQAKTPKDRDKIFHAIFDYYEANKNTLAKIYELGFTMDFANIKARKFDTILESYLFKNNIPTSVYYNLVDVASKNNAAVKKYIRLRKQYLGLKTYHTYDRFLPLATSNKKYSFDEAKELFFASLVSTPKDFQEKAHEVLRDGFVDVYEKDGKRSGAYSSSQPNLHPYILLNYADTLDDVFTVAHESGHSTHS